jgi:regulatory protein
MIWFGSIIFEYFQKLWQICPAFIFLGGNTSIGVITALKIQARNKERVNVFIDDAYALAVTLFVAAGLKKGQHLSEAEIEQLKTQDLRHKAYARAIHFLGYRDRSRTEIEKYLQKKDYPPDVVVDVIEQLQQENYLNDSSFAQNWLENRIRFRPKGATALRYELRQKGIAAETIEDILENLDETGLAQQAIEKKLSQWKNLDQTKFRTKGIGFLSRRGFAYEIARDVIDEAWAALQHQNNL